MELATVYKSTEAGRIPSDWEVKRVDEIAEVRGGKRLPKGRSLTSTPTPHPYIRVSDMKPGGVDPRGIMYVPNDVAPSIQSYKIFEGDIFISVAGTLGIVGKVPPNLDGANLTENADRVTSITCDRDYLMAHLASDRIQREIESVRTVGAQPKLALNRIESFLIPLPPTLQEQRAIAAALSEVDDLLAALDALIEKKRAVKTAAMQRLLTGRQRLPGFSGEWKTLRIGSFGSAYGGITGKTKNDFGTGSARYIPFMNVMANVTIDPGFLERVDIASGESQNVVARGDLLFNTSSETPEELAMCSALTEDVGEVYLNSFCFGFRLSDRSISPLYLAYYFRGEPGRALMYSMAQGATRYNLSKRSFLNLLVTLPGAEEQAAIAAVLSGMDAEVAALEARREKTRMIKQGMMQELLTGRTRLVPSH